MVQPVDMQSLIGNIISAERVQHIVERQASVEQQRAAFQEHAERAQQETQVQHTHEAEGERIEEEQQRQSQGRDQGRQQPGQEEPGQEEDAGGVSHALPEQPIEVRTVYNSHEETEDLSGTEGHNLDVRV